MGRAGSRALMLMMAVAAAVLLLASCGDTAEEDTSGPTDPQSESEESVPATGDGDANAGQPRPDFEPPEIDLSVDVDGPIQDFLDVRSATSGAVVAEALGLRGDPRYGPWLLDLLRLGRSSRVDDIVAASFERLSGIEQGGSRPADYKIYGTWVYNNDVDPGPGYGEWKRVLYGEIDDDFAALLSDITDPDLLVGIQWGGVPRGGIPELNDPARIPSAEADWMTADELVLGAVIDGEAVAYPIRILGHHELANDVIAGRPVSMVYCPLCLSAVLFDRRVDGQVLDFQTSGLLIQSNKIMVDVQTDTLWRHQTGIGLTGPLEGRTLEQYPVQTIGWAEWLEQYPDSEVLDIPPPTFFDEPERPPIAYPYEPGGAYRSYYDDPDVWFPVLDTPNVFDLKEPVVGLRSGPVDDPATDFLAIRLSALLGDGPRVFAVGDRQVALVPTGGNVRGYDVTGSILEPGRIELEVEATESTMTTTDGRGWERIPVDRLFWFAWFGDHPETSWWPQQS